MYVFSAAGDDVVESFFTASAIWACSSCVAQTLSASFAGSGVILAVGKLAVSAAAAAVGSAPPKEYTSNCALSFPCGPASSWSRMPAIRLWSALVALTMSFMPAWSGVIVAVGTSGVTTPSAAATAVFFK